MKLIAMVGALVVAFPAVAGKSYEPPRSPLQPSYYTENRVENRNTNDNRSNANAQATANGGNVSNHTSASGGAGGSVGNIQSSAVGGAGGSGGAGGLGGAGGSVGGVSVENDIRYEQRRIPVNTAYAPGLTSSGEDTCLGSISGGAQHAVFGISVGKTVTDANCVKLKRSKMLASLGEREAALAMWCNEADTATALSLAGVRCDELGRARTQRLLALSSAMRLVASPAPVALATPPKPTCKAKAKRKPKCSQ